MLTTAEKQLLSLIDRDPGHLIKHYALELDMPPAIALDIAERLIAQQCIKRNLNTEKLHPVTLPIWPAANVLKPVESEPAAPAAEEHDNTKPATGEALRQQILTVLDGFVAKSTMQIAHELGIKVARVGAPLGWLRANGFVTSTGSAGCRLWTRIDRQVTSISSIAKKHTEANEPEDAELLSREVEALRVRLSAPPAPPPPSQLWPIVLRDLAPAVGGRIAATLEQIASYLEGAQQ